MISMFHFYFVELWFFVFHHFVVKMLCLVADDIIMYSPVEA